MTMQTTNIKAIRFYNLVAQQVQGRATCMHTCEYFWKGRKIGKKTKLSGVKSQIFVMFRFADARRQNEQMNK